MPITTLPFFLISSGVIANADRVMSAGAARKAAPAIRTLRRLSFSSLASFIVSSSGDLAWLTKMLPNRSSGCRGKLAFQPGAIQRQRPADKEIDDPHDAEHEQRLEDLVGDHASGTGEFGEADKGRQRGPL